MGDKACSVYLPSPGLEGGIVCRVPSEEVVCFLAPTGECHKLMQTSERMYEQVASFSGITGQESFFTFSVGSIQAQTLHVGIVNQQKIMLHQYRTRAWQPVGSCGFDSTAA